MCLTIDIKFIKYKVILYKTFIGEYIRNKMLPGCNKVARCPDMYNEAWSG